ncbi:MAG: alpha/beta hydrolase [Desulfotomaculales bacterium]
MPSQESAGVRQFLLKRKMAEAGKTFTVEEMRQNLEAMFANRPLEPEIKVEKITAEGIPAEWVDAPNAAPEGAVLYLHGGAYIMGSCNTHRGLAAKFSRAASARVLLIEYRLAPENPFPAALEDAVTAYRWLLSAGFAPQCLAVAGDSAGGGLAVAALLKLRDDGVPLPAAAVLMSPWTDLEGTGESVKTKAEIDPWLQAEGLRPLANLYLRDLDPRHPLASPIYADLRGLPPLLVHVGEDEILLDDSVRLVERARAAGVEVTFKIWEGMWHVFQGFADVLPEGRQAIAEIGEFLKGRLCGT